MYCTKCGKRISDDEKTCSGCEEPIHGFRQQRNIKDLRGTRNALTFVFGLVGALVYLYLISIMIPNIEGVAGWSRSWYDTLPGVFLRYPFQQLCQLCLLAFLVK